MNLNFIRKLPIPKEIKGQFPITKEAAYKKNKIDEEIKNILSGDSKKMLLIVGPCSADNEDSVLEYISRLSRLQEKVKDKLLFIPRIYTNKPRTTGTGYMGMLYSPNPKTSPDLLKGIIATRNLHIKVLTDYGFSTANEMLYPEDHRYLNDLISYIAVGARSVENQQHRLTASGLNIPVGMKNPTGGDISVMMNAIFSAQNPHIFEYRGWEVESFGNPYAHAILRGYTDSTGRTVSNYHYEDLINVCDAYNKNNYQNPAIIIDANHDNSGKNYLQQIAIIKDVLHSIKLSNDIRNTVKGFMLESYLEDGCQAIGENVYGKSITDPCLGWNKTEKLIYEMAELI